MATIQDTDLLYVQRGDTPHNWTGQELLAQVTASASDGKLSVGQYLTPFGQTYDGSADLTINLDGVPEATPLKAVVRDAEGSFAGNKITVTTVEVTDITVNGNITGNGNFSGNLEVDGYIHADGNITADGSISAGDGLTEGVYLSAEGRVYSTRDSNDPVWSGYTKGNGTPTSTIDADGSITGAGGDFKVNYEGDTLGAKVDIKRSSESTALAVMDMDGNTDIELKAGGDITAVGEATFGKSDGYRVVIRPFDSDNAGQLFIRKSDDTDSFTVDGGGNVVANGNVDLTDSTIDLYSKTTTGTSKTFQLFSDVGSTKAEKVSIEANGNITTVGTIKANGALNIEGGATVDGTLNVTGQITGNVTGDLTGNADTATQAANADKLDNLDSLQFLRSDTADTAAGDITFSGGAGAITLAADSDIRLNTGAWTGEACKIQHHSNILYIQGGSLGFQFRSLGGTTWYELDSSGNFFPSSDDARNLGAAANRFANAYATTFHGNLTGNVTGNVIGNIQGKADDSALLNGHVESTSATANTIVERDSSGDIYGRYIYGSYTNMSHSTATRNSDTIFYSSTDDFIRKNNASGFRSSLDVPTRTGGNASGSWAISVTGSSASCTGNAASASTVTVNDSNGDSSYRVLWHSGNTIYSTAGIYLNASNNYMYASSFQASDWFRSTGDTGWYSQTHGGGINMQDTTWVRVYGSKAFYVNNQIAATSNVTAYYSDERLKEKLGDIKGAVKKVCAIETMYYKHNDVAKELGYRGDDQQIGVTAQSVKKVAPEVVSLAPIDMHTEEDGSVVSKTGEDYMTVDYSKLVPLLIESVKEQQKQINKLERRIKQLES